MQQPNCTLCAPSRGVVADNDHWTMVVNENQATLGRVYFALKRHETDVTALTETEVLSLWRFLAEARAALNAAFAPDHFNFMFHMNIDPHAHMHIYPRYRELRVFAGREFTDSRYGGHYDPDQVVAIDDALRDALVETLRHNLPPLVVSP